MTTLTLSRDQVGEDVLEFVERIRDVISNEQAWFLVDEFRRQAYSSGWDDGYATAEDQYREPQPTGV